MAGVTEPGPDPRQPGERRLARPPSERYRTPPTAADAGTAGAAPERAGSPARGIAFGAIAALGGAVAIVVLGGVLAISAGLLVVAVTAGYAVGVATKVGARAGADGDAARRPTWRWTVVGLAVAGVLVGQIGLWLFARTEGGVLSLPDYLDQTFGALVPLQVVLAGLAAWWTAR
jgi:hypothetical protein